MPTTPTESQLPPFVAGADIDTIADDVENPDARLRLWRASWKWQGLRDFDVSSVTESAKAGRIFYARGGLQSGRFEAAAQVDLDELGDALLKRAVESWSALVQEAPPKVTKRTAECALSLIGWASEKLRWTPYRHEFAERLRELVLATQEDEPDELVNLAESLRGFFLFLIEMPNISKPSVTIAPGGYVHATWRSGSNSLVANFLGEAVINYALFDFGQSATASPNRLAGTASRQSLVAALAAQRAQTWLADGTMA